MKKFGIFVAIMLGLYLCYQLIYPSYTYRYRMVVEIDVGGEIRSGASVIEVTLSKQPKFLPEVSSLATTAIGEAVFVDLGKNRHVIAVLASGSHGSDVDYPKHLVNRLFKLSVEDRDLMKFPQLQGSRDIEGLLPTLVTFTNLSDPQTVQVVYANEVVETRDERKILRRNLHVTVDRFTELFGPGVRFRRAFIEVVPAGTWPFRTLGWPVSLAGVPVTRGIEQRMPEIIRQLREQARQMQIRNVGAPYSPRLGHFSIGG